MKSKILLIAMAVAILGSFAFITIDKKNNANHKTVTIPTKNLNGITMEDNTF